MKPVDQTADELQLRALGHKGELQRNFSLISMLGLAFAILNTWTALGVSLTATLPSGGPTSAIWGLVSVGVCNVALAASLAEFLSAYPTAGGQYVSRLVFKARNANMTGTIGLQSSHQKNGLRWHHTLQAGSTSQDGLP